MANPDLSAGALQKPQPRALTKGRKRAQEAADLEAAYADVDLRDGPTSRISGRYTQAGAIDPRVRREHHHIRPRSTHPSLAADASNIFVCSSEEHQLIHAGALIVEGVDACKELRFHWNYEICERGKEPFRIKSRRWSQRDEE